MTESTILATISALAVGSLVFALRYALQQDRQTVLDRKCPPHKWEAQYKASPDNNPGGLEYVGLKCAKCNRRPGWANAAGNGYIGPLAF